VVFSPLMAAISNVALGGMLGVVVSSAVLAQGVVLPSSDLTSRSRVIFLVFGDSGTGESGQARVGQAMYQTCRARGCDFALLLGDALYENGIEVDDRMDAGRSRDAIKGQFRTKFEQPYEAFHQLPGFRFWVALGNHDYRRNALASLVDYASLSDLWGLPAFNYEVPRLPAWLQIHAIHTDADVRRDLNGIQVEAIRQRLCAESPSARWRFAFGHHPVFSSGHHRGDGNERRVRALLVEPLFRPCGVHAYFAGHAHHQEHLTAPGFEQVVQGAAARLRGNNRPDGRSLARQRYFSRSFGFAIVEVDAERLRLDFYDVANTRERGRQQDLLPADTVLRYSWCGTRADVGRPERTDARCE
jgi:Calcineurin-like phosphoesterase